MARSTTLALAEGLVPTMTSNTTPSGECSASGVYGAYKIYSAFDNDDSTEWFSETGTTERYIQYKFNTPVTVNVIKMKAGAGASKPSKFTIDVSTNGNNFVTIKEVSSSNWADGVLYDIVLDNDAPYICYRITFKNVSTTSSSSSIREIQFYESVDITTSQDAMSLIGKYDYCSNALLSNATWAEAICKSEYFEEVLNVSVPKMTSNTAPSGEVSAESYYNNNYVPWRAFNGSLNDGWAALGDKQDTWIQYKFDTVVKINKASIYDRTSVSGVKKHYKIQGSNDGTNWTDLASITVHIGQTWEDVSFGNTTSYIYYRAYFVGSESTHAQGYGTGTNIQFYGRASAQTNIIHSAANDTIYMMKDGSPSVLTTTDINGVGTLDFTQFDDGVTYKLYSSVAKDPNNLSNDYSKNIRITKNKYGCTTEAYLMPDPVKTLYWYGCKPYAYNTNNITFNTNTFTLDYRSASAQSWLMPTSKFNISNYSKGHIITDVYDGSWIYVGLYESPRYNPDKIVVNQCRGNKHSEGDLSSYSGEYYFGVSGSNGLAQYVSTEYLDVAALWLE